MNEIIALTSLFVAVLIIAFLFINYLNSRRDISEKLQKANPTYFGNNSQTDEQFEKLISTDNEYIAHYFNVIKKNEPDSLEFRLIRAGYFSKAALRNFNFIRIAIAFLIFLVVTYLIGTYLVSVSTTTAILISMIFSAVSFILANAVLDRMGANKQTAYRKMFPEFMDMLIVCVDSGLSIEAAINRVAIEFLQTTPDFGTHLNIMMLEVRAGRPLRDALSNFASRLNIDEAKSLAILFRQSEELGSSVTKTLRVFSREMRQMRMIRAEEKANSLPIKMLFPLALFLFPTNLIIVLVPIIIRVGAMFQSITPTSL